MQILAIDLDGTLLTDDHQITEQNKHAIQLASEAGYIIVIATGRTVYSATEFFKILKVNGFVVALNGAVVIDIKNFQIIKKTALSQDAAHAMLEIGKLYQVSVSLCCLDKNYRVDFSGKNKELIQKFVPGQTPFEIRSYESAKKLIDQVPIYKIGIMNENVGLLDEMKQRLYDMGYDVIFSDTHYIELMASGVHKGASVKLLAEQLEIDSDDVIAFGDQENDIGLFSFAGTSYAMSNAKPLLKEKADFVVDTNNESGVGKQILKLLEEEKRQSDAK